LCIVRAREVSVLRKAGSSFAPRVDIETWDNMTADRYHT
jgi:hypothetical protein